MTIYLDNAATSFPSPSRSQGDGKGYEILCQSGPIGTSNGVESGRVIHRTRSDRKPLQAENTLRIISDPNGTEALNLGSGYLRLGTMWLPPAWSIILYFAH